MAALSRVVGALRAALDRLVVAPLLAAGDEADRIATALYRSSQGAGQPRLGQAVGEIGTAREHLDKAAQRLMAVREQLEHCLARLTGVPQSMVGGEPVGRDPPAAGPVTARWVRASRPPEWVDTGGVRFAPRAPVDGRVTSGILTGGSIEGESLSSGGHDKALADDLDLPRLRDGTPPAVVYRHVEGQAAARLRRSSVNRAELAIDNTMCGSNERDFSAPFTCERLLASIMPAGSQLRVWSTSDGGYSWWLAVFTGTGERIRA